MRSKIVAGNWKMNMNAVQARELFNELVSKSVNYPSDVEVVVAPPAIYLSEFSQMDLGKVKLSSQYCSEKENGAFTGGISAEMLSSLGVDYCIVGHSERRAFYKKTNQQLKEKVDSLLSHNVTPIYCCGETLEEREAGSEFDVVGSQIKEALFHLSNEDIKRVVIAYEPVWAIGTGKTASAEQAQEIHAFIRKILEEQYVTETAAQVSILYGGSCKPTNAQELFANADVDGGLIGGAALKEDSFQGIINGFN